MTGVARDAPAVSTAAGKESAKTAARSVRRAPGRERLEAMATTPTGRARPTVLLAVALGLSACGSAAATGATARATSHGPSRPRPVTARVLGSGLAAPLSREVVLAGPGRDLVVLGGLDAQDSSASGVFLLDTASGRLREVGALSSPVHDAGGVVLAGRDVLFGGGATVSVAAVEAFPAPRATAHGLAGSVLGALPGARSDDVAAEIGTTAYVVGGYDGLDGDATVLATSDGRHFRSVATLPVPVRYAALAAYGGRLYVFGGEAIGGPASGTAVRAVQVVDPRTGSARVVAHLPEPLAGAAAAVLGGAIYLAGGDTVTTPAGGGSGTAATIWSFTPQTKRFRVVGHLVKPVSHAGVAVLAGRVWLVGGESQGVTVSTIQSFGPR